MSSRAVSRNNIFAGLFLIGCLVLAVVMSVVVSGAAERLTPTTPYVIAFTLQDGAAGIKSGSPILMGGQKIGRVTGVRIVPDAQGRPTGIEVRVRVRTSVVLFEDAWVFLERPLLGNLSTVNFTNPGDGSTVEAPQGGDPRLQSGERLAGTVAPPAFLSQAGYGPEQAAQVRQIIDRVSHIVEQADSIIGRVDEQVDPAIADARAAIEDIRDMAADLEAKLPEWTGRVDTVLANAEEASKDFDPITEGVKSGVEEARGVVRSAQGAIDDNRPRIDEIVRNVESTTERFDTETGPKIDKLVDDATAGVEGFAAASDEAATLLAQESPNIRRILANARLASDQLKLAMVEIRQSPWRLLYRPKTKELREQLLYDAARTYAEAVSDLRAAGESLESAAASDGSPLALDRDTIEGMTRRVTEAFEKYRAAEKALLEHLEKQSGQ